MTAGSGRPVTLVTGGRGRIGRLLVDELRRSGERVFSLARSLDEDPHPDDLLGDAQRPADVRAALAVSRPEVVVHLASVLRGDDLESANRRIDLALAEAMKGTTVRHLVHASSGAVYGDRHADRRSEHHPLEGNTPYARSKIEGERIFSELAEANPEMSLVILRIFNVAGPALTESLVQKLLRAESGSPVTIAGADHVVRDYIHQEDLIEVIRAAMGVSGQRTSIINVGAGVPVSTRRLLASLSIDPALVREVGGPQSSNWADISAMSERLGVRPRAVPDPTWD